MSYLAFLLGDGILFCDSKYKTLIINNIWTPSVIKFVRASRIAVRGRFMKTISTIPNPLRTRPQHLQPPNKMSSVKIIYLEIFLLIQLAIKLDSNLPHKL